MNKVQEYISRARGNNARNLNFVNNPRMNANFASQGNLYANGQAAGPASPAKKSMPYAVTVSSSSGSAVQNFDVLGAYTYINNAGMTAGGDLVVGSITITSAIPGVSYRDLLYQSMTNVFTVGQTYLSCTSPTSQLLETFTIVTKDATGVQVNIPIVPAIDPYQQQLSVLVIEQEYSIDGFTKLTFANILPNAVLSIRWYASQNINPARSLTDTAPQQSFGPATLIRQ